TAIVALLVIVSSFPLYKMVRQEYTPGDVDEGEFEVRVNAPEGTALTAMNEATQIIENEVRSLPGVQLVLGGVGGGSFLGSVNSGRLYVKLIPHDERLFTLERLWRELRAGHPFAAFRTIHQRDVVK